MKVERQTGSGQNKKISRTILIFISFMVLCFIGGFAIGYAIKRFAGKNISIHFFNITSSPFLLYALPVVLVVFWLVVGLLCFGLYQKAKKKYLAWDGDDETVINFTEYLLNLCGVINSSAIIIDLFLFAVWIYAEQSLQAPFPNTKTMTILFTVIYMVGLAIAILIQHAVVELEKKINPEKKGNVFELNFSKTWEKSFDEAQMQIQCQAAYKALKKVNTLCMFLWLCCILGETILNIGIIPAITITVIWLSLTITYQIEVIKLERAD